MSNNNDAAIALLEKHFDIAFAAPDGIKKLRELILSLAMQGKLVPQDPSDQPASELLKEIGAEKNRLVKEGKIKQSKPLPEIKPKEIPYDLPKGWEWSRLGECTNIIMGQSPDSNSYNEEGQGLPFFQGKSEYGVIYPTPRKWCTLPLKVAPVKSVLISVRAPVGPTNICNIIACIGRGLAAIQGLANTPEFFLLYYFRCFEKHIASFGTGSTFSAITLKVLENLLVPLPPLAEQRRIVAKIDELMARCDELKKLRSDRDRQQITVHTAALNRLLIAKEQSEFNTAWQFITQHFSELYLVKENVAELRKAILQLAVMGKLVPQDSKDQPASELLKEIEKEKERLVKEGKIKKSKPLPEIKSNEFPYNLPKSWEWVRFGIIVQSMTNGLYKPSQFYSDKGVKIVRMFNIQDGFLDIEQVKRIEVTQEEIENYKLSLGDILVNRVNSLELIGKSALVRDEDLQDKLVFEAMNIRVSCFFRETNLPNYANLLLQTINARSYLIGQAKRALGQVSINQPQVSNLLFPLPPLAEQRRIVAKIDQLMALCDNLEKQINNANSKQTNLLNAVMTKI